MYIKAFDQWNNQKKILQNATGAHPFFKERDVWWVSIGINLGFEEDGKGDLSQRPVLIVKKFNTELFIGVPMSTKIKDNPHYIEVTLQEKHVSVITSQIKSISSKRLLYKLGELDKGDYNKITTQLKSYFKIFTFS